MRERVRCVICSRPVTPDPRSRRLFYTAALTGLRFVDRRTGQRRFGEDADARWLPFAGDLHLADRLDLLLRDADAQWPGAFGARTVFDLPEVAEDDAFGADWQPLDDEDARELWRDITAQPPPDDLAALVRRLFGVWETPFEPVPLPELTPTSRWLLFTPDAVASALLAFAAGSDLAWSDQVVIAVHSPLLLREKDHPRAPLTRALTRQLAAMAPALLGHQLRPTAFAALDQPYQPRADEQLVGLRPGLPDFELCQAWLHRKASAA